MIFNVEIKIKDSDEEEKKAIDAIKAKVKQLKRDLDQKKANLRKLFSRKYLNMYQSYSTQIHYISMIFLLTNSRQKAFTIAMTIDFEFKSFGRNELFLFVTYYELKLFLAFI